MQSTPNLRDTDPHDVFVIEPDVSLAARAHKAPLDLLYDVLSHPSVPRPSDPAPAQVRPDPELRIAPDFSASASVPPVAVARAPVADDTPVDDIQLGETEISAHQPTTSKFARRVVMGLFALVSATGAAAWQHYGDDAKAMVAKWTPPLALTSLLSTAKPAATEPAPAVQAAGDQVTTPSPAQSAVNAPAIAAPVAPEQAQQLQAMARDIAAMGQQIGELKASIEQLRASQQQATTAPPRTEAKLVEPKSVEPRLVEAKPAEPVLSRPRIVPPPAHSTVSTLARRPKQTFPYAPIAPAPPPQATAAPAQIAPQPQMAEDGGPVVRPPLALH
jgi:hypothetical protein